MKTTVNSARRGFLGRRARRSQRRRHRQRARAPRGPGDRDASQARLAQLEDVNAIRELTRSYVRHVNAGAHGEAAALFARTRARRRAPPPAQLAADPLGGEDAIEIEASGMTPPRGCTARPRSLRRSSPVTPLVEMARAQGGGVLKRSERGVLEGAYVKRDGCWKIERLAFRAS